MKYPLVPLVTDLTFPLLFFWVCLPFLMLLIMIMIWLQLLLNEVEMLSEEDIKKQSSDDPDSDSKLGDESTEEESQNDTSSTEMYEEIQSSGYVETLRPRHAYLSSNPKSQKPSLLSVIANSWSLSQKIRYSHAEKSDFCNIVMVLCTMISSLTWNLVCQLLQSSNFLRILLLPPSLIISVSQLLTLLGKKAVKALDSLRLESRELLASFLGRNRAMELREPPQGGNEAGGPTWHQ